MNWLQLLNRKWLLWTLLVIVAAGVCVRLGFWQLDRLKQRRAFNAHIYALQAMAPVKLPTDSGLEGLTDMEYRAATATGIYDFAHQVVIRNQYNSNSELGYDLLTPLVMQSGEAVLVNRGWIPATGNDTPAAWQKYDVPGPVSVNGVIRLSQTDTGFFAAPADPTLTPGQKGLDQWIFINVGRIAQQLPYRVLPVYIQQSPAASSINPPIPLQVQLDLSEGPHESYAIQWFSFATIMLVGYPFYVRRQEKSTHETRHFSARTP